MAGSAKSDDDVKKSKSSVLAESLARLNLALDGLDKSVADNKKRNTADMSTDEQVQRMADDRAKLARDLDAAEERAGVLKNVNSEVSRRLVNAMEMVRGVLEQK